MVNKMITDIEIVKIEKALGVKLFPNVVSYLTTDKGEYFNSRGTGKTLAYCIKLALCKNREISLNDLKKGVYNDEYHGWQYNSFFTREFLKVRNKLKDYGFDVIKVTYCRRYL